VPHELNQLRPRVGIGDFAEDFQELKALFDEIDISLVLGLFSRAG
jgi:hypothetical protein